MKSSTSNLKTILLFSSFVLFFCFACEFAYSQPADLDDPSDPTPIPIDGGISLLVAAGTAYGIKKLYEAKKSKKDADTPSTI